MRYLQDTVQLFTTGGILPTIRLAAEGFGNFTDKVRDSRGWMIQFGQEFQKFGEQAATAGGSDPMEGIAEASRRTIADRREEIATREGAIEIACADDSGAIRAFQDRIKVLQKELDTALGQVEAMPDLLQNVERSARSISTVTIADGWNKQVQDATRQIEREFDVLRQKANVFEGFDLAGERVRVVERALNGLIESGVNPNITQMQELIALYRELQIEAGGSDRKSTRLNSSHVAISYAVFCLKKKK